MSAEHSHGHHSHEHHSHEHHSHEHHTKGAYAVVDPDDPVGKSHQLNYAYESDLEKWLKMFQSDSRSQDCRFQDVATLIQKALQPKGDTVRVAEIGAGTGICLFNLAKVLKESFQTQQGKKVQVFASEPTQNFLNYMRQQLKDVHVDIQDVVHIIQGTTEEPGFRAPEEKADEDPSRLPKHSLDAVTLHNTFHHIEARVRFMRRLREDWITPGTGIVFIQD